MPPAPPASQLEVRTWAEAAGAPGSGAPPPHGQQTGREIAQARRRLGSTSSQQKRSREEEEAFQQFQTRNQARRQRKVAYGCSQVSIEDDGAAAPLEFYVGNTTTRATKEIIESVMAKCAKAIQPETNFCVLEVQQLATHLVNPHTIGSY